MGNVAVHVDFGDTAPAALAQCFATPRPLVSETSRSLDQRPSTRRHANSNSFRADPLDLPFKGDVGLPAPGDGFFA
jgi:hypothetical protein